MQAVPAECAFYLGTKSTSEFLMKENRTRVNHTTVYGDWRDDKIWPDIDWDCPDKYEVNAEVETLVVGLFAFDPIMLSQTRTHIVFRCAQITGCYLL